MGGFGSGRPGWKAKADHYRSLDVNKMHRAGSLTPGRWGGWQWTVDGEQVASIRYRAEENRLVLSYRWRYGDGDWQETEEPVPILRVPCRYGGTRPYFRCPGVVNGRYCGRRVAKLYAAGRYFLCRHCYRLAYASQSEARFDRALRRANKRRMALGGDPGMASAIPRKPKGMWWRTYDRIMDEISEAEGEADRALLARFVGRLSHAELMNLIG